MGWGAAFSRSLETRVRHERRLFGGLGAQHALGDLDHLHPCELGYLDELIEAK